MNKKLCLFSLLIFFVLISCDINNSSTVTINDYENATFHMGRSLNKYLNNVLTFQKWDKDEFFHYKVKLRDKTESFTIDLNLLEKSNYKEIDEVNLKIINKDYNKNLYEFISPDGNVAAYINDFNLWIRNTKTDKRTQLTFDGIKDYGYATNNAGWIQSKVPVLKWSPKSDKIATFRQDAREVGEMYLTSTNVGHPKLQAWKYALPGDEKIFEIERLIIDVKSKKIIKLKMENDFQRSTTTDHIAGRGGELLDAQWSEDSSKLAFISSSRDHKEAHLQIADSKTGIVRSVFKENVDTYYESGVRAENWRVLFDSDEFIWYSEKNDWGHIYLYDLNTKKLKNRITNGNWLVRKVMHIDNDKREIIFSAGGKEEGNPYHIYFYKVDFSGNNLICLTPEKGSHTINPSPNWDYFVTTYSTTKTAPKSILKDRDGKTLLQLSSSNTDDLKINGWQEPLEFNVKARDDETDLFGLMYIPSFYDKNDKYPVLNYIYPGPQSGSVGNYSFMVARRDFQALAELGFIVVALDAMGTPGRSKSFHDAYYGNMGDNGLPDNIKAIEQLSKKYSGMDLSRIGIWGHSGGGFASTAALLRYPDFYDVAVSSSGNHDNRNYEADWGEKWHGLLEPLTQSKENNSKFDSKKNNYDIQANQLIVKNLKGKLLIAHGMLDDNVPPSNTMLVVDELIKANKDFDLILFPNKRHGYGDMSNYMMRRKWDYFVKNLKGLDPPSNFSFD
ncbi:S9 family peptidase [bacterium]|nr:S9 family peptidase [Flavobacteriaceae bacterium]MDB9871553.1 S9 family peptidase [bacterium]MDA7716737.1 S9 family peptidase [Flavobacteriaceae bacterium]MDA8734204.1 S9 family peptidase [Flavobacteriaceae bacterium]MDA9977480.1 S9 family peptidase [Flavobacteriaceae bacterium]